MVVVSPKWLFLWTVATAASWNAQLVNAQTTTLTVEIDIDGDGRITFDQNGFVPLPFPLPNNPLLGTLPFSSSFWRADEGSRFKSVGAVNGLPSSASTSDLYELNLVEAQTSFDCLLALDTFPPPLEIVPAIPTAILTRFTLTGQPEAGSIELPRGYAGDDLTQAAASKDTGLNLASAGFNEGQTCFVEYDTDGDITNGNDARLEWRVIGAPSSSPSESLHPSSNPSSSATPSAQTSSSPSAQPSSSPSAQPTCLKRSTKSPGKGKGRKMRKTTKTAAPTGCLETKSPGKGMMGGKGMMMRGKGRRGKGN